MKTRALNSLGMLALLAFSTASLLAAVDYSASMRDLKLPVFDATGHLARRLTAESAVASLTSSRLGKGQVEFFAPASADQSIAVLGFERAHYVTADERIDGDGTIEFTAKDGHVQGQGFECQLKTGLLTLQSAVKFNSAAIQLTGDHGDVHFDPKASGDESLIKEAVLTGHVIVDRTATTQAPFERAETTFARYSAEQQKVFLKLPMTIWAHGLQSIMEKTAKAEFFEVTLKDKPNRP